MKVISHDTDVGKFIVCIKGGGLELEQEFKTLKEAMELFNTIPEGELYISFYGIVNAESDERKMIRKILFKKEFYL